MLVVFSQILDSQNSDPKVHFDNSPVKYSSLGAKCSTGNLLGKMKLARIEHFQFEK